MSPGVCVCFLHGRAVCKPTMDTRNTMFFWPLTVLVSAFLVLGVGRGGGGGGAGNWHSMWPLGTLCVSHVPVLSLFLWR